VCAGGEELVTLLGIDPCIEIHRNTVVTFYFQAAACIVKVGEAERMPLLQLARNVTCFKAGRGNTDT
jgi:hypothetical protein